jgi:hypothetical protein
MVSDSLVHWNNKHTLYFFPVSSLNSLIQQNKFHRFLRQVRIVLTRMFLSWSMRGWMGGGDGMKTSLNSYR